MITFTFEAFSSVYAELYPLLEKHYGEISTHRDYGVPLAPQIDAYKRREQDGSLLMVIGREKGVIIAYFVCFIAPALHYASCLTCSPDIFFVSPEYRNGRTGVRMFKFLENELKRRGVQRWAVGSKTEHDASALFKYLGFYPVETTYEKWL